jgi:hypothetical protein
MCVSTTRDLAVATETYTKQTMEFDAEHALMLSLLKAVLVSGRFADQARDG